MRDERWPGRHAPAFYIGQSPAVTAKVIRLTTLNSIPRGLESLRVCAFRVLVSLCLIAVAAAGYAAGLSCEVKRVSVGGKAFSARVVRVPLSSYRVKVALAGGRVGATESLSAIAKRDGAAAAINGCFFDADGRYAQMYRQQYWLDEEGADEDQEDE